MKSFVPACGHLSRRLCFPALAGFVPVVVVSPALAIPSPELIVGSAASISQLVALVSALLGGGAAVATVQARRRGVAGHSRWVVGAFAASLVIAIASVVFNVVQYVGARDEKRARLEDTLLRPSRTPGGLPLDPEVKELNYTQQTRHPLAMSTAEADRLLTAAAHGEANDIVFLDVREAAEREMGTLPGVRFVRYPDIQAANIDFTGKKAVLFCHNGNRSHEVCEALAKAGIDCRFIAGGLEKWVVENRSMDGFGARSLDQLRAIPDYPNRNTLLDTPDVRRLVRDETAIFVDVRYPHEFSQQHLPDAINLSIRRLPTPELRRQIAALPPRPIILPCYDRRGCFFAEVLGLELARAGHDVRGRYTVPWLYFVPGRRPPHVDAWIAENNRSIWDKASRHVAAALSAIGAWIGLVPAIALLALLSRLVVLPVSLKAERDQMRMRSASSDLEAMRQRLSDDRVRRGRAIRAAYKKLGLTPVRNLLALVFIPIMAVMVMAVETATKGAHASFMWIGDLALGDPLYILPLAFAAALSLYLDIAIARRRNHRIAVWAAAFPALAAMSTLFSAGAQFYLLASAALLLLQRLAMSGGLRRIASAWRRLRLGGDVFTLDEPDRLAQYGNKAHRLAVMRCNGLPVPTGVLLTPRFLERLASAAPERRRRILGRIWSWLGSDRVAVRSSAQAEDGEQHSYAGVFESVLDVGPDGLEAAILRVDASFRSDRRRAYGGGEGTGGVLVQRMILADYAGVLFTRAPASEGIALCEYVRGTAENFVSGAARPFTCRIGRVSGECLDEDIPPFDVGALVNLGRRAEALFGKAQDIEWALLDGKFHVVQSRDITRTIEDQSEAGLVRLAASQALDAVSGAKADNPAFARSELCEMLPQPTPLSLSLVRAMWAPGGSIDLACRRLQIDYAPSEDAPEYLVTILGRLYVNQSEERARTIRISSLAARRLRRIGPALEEHFREAFLPAYLDEARLLEAVDFNALTLPALFDAVARLQRQFLTEVHVEADVINVAANFYLEQARRKLDPDDLDASELLQAIPETHQARVIRSASRLPADERRLVLLAEMGHRAILDYELSEPRFAEDGVALGRMIEFSRARPPGEIAKAVPESRDRRAGDVFELARRFQALKEDAKHHSLRHAAILRRALLALDRRLDFSGLVFFLTFGEVLELERRPVMEMHLIAEARREQRACLLAIPPLPAVLTARDLERIAAGVQTAAKESTESIRGTRVSGTKPAQGRARVVADRDAEVGAPIAGFQDGDIIVASMIHPSWLPYFARAGGFVARLGGWLSHTAILAREYDVAMVVNTEGIDSIATGDILRIDLCGTIEVLEQAKPVSAIAA